jgi:hypothetical protein
MQIDVQVITAYLDQAFDGMRAVMGRVDAHELNTRPFGDETNSITALVMHCTELCEFWLGHVGLGHPTERQRDREFSYEANHAEMEERIARAQNAAGGHVARLAAGEGTPSPIRDTLIGDPGDLSIVLHVLEELYQHLGHMDITADALEARR